MTFDAHTNFAYSTVATAPSPASSGTSLVVAAGTGALFPAASFNAVVWATGANPISTNAEVVRVTVKSTDTFTITRAQESSSARSIVVGDQIMAAATAKTFTDIEGSMLASGTSFPGSPADGDWFYRTDRNVLYFYKLSITRWLTVDLKEVTFSQPQFLIPTTDGSDNSIGRIAIYEDTYIEKWVTVTDVLSTNDGSNFHTATLYKNATVASSFDTSGDTLATRTIHAVAINSLIATASFQWMDVHFTKTGTPGNLYASTMLTYRKAG